MGKWTLDSLTVESKLRDVDVFGNHVVAVYWLKYESTWFGTFVDAPALYWHEQIVLVDHQNANAWIFECNQYERNPLSPSLRVWCEKYWKAYDNIAYGDGDRFAGVAHVRLFDNKKIPVTGEQFKDKKASNREKAEAVRSYLKKNGGFLRITIEDKPGINTDVAGGQFKERRLLFHCGIVGQDEEARVKYEQYLAVNSKLERSEWLRVCRQGWLNEIKVPSSYTFIAPPKRVTAREPAAIDPAYGNYY